MRYLGTIFVLLAAAVSLTVAQVNPSTAYNYPTLPGTSADSVLNGLGSIRGVAFDNDIDGDGKAEIVATNYNDLGHVHLFEVFGNDSIQLKWTSPKVPGGGGGSTPRYVAIGDLDNDGRKEIMFQSDNNGIFIYEWDGVNGSDNYGTTFSAFIDTTVMGISPGVNMGNCEYFEVVDVDNDGANELLVAMNNVPNANDKYYIISAIGGWSTDNPGLSSFNVELAAVRTDLTKWGIGGGSPYAMISAQFDGTGPREILIHNWNRKNVSPMIVDSANYYSFADTTNNKQNLYLGGAVDDVALFGAFAVDIDRDGREEVYLPTYLGGGSSANAGKIDMIYYNPGSNLSEIDSSNLFVLNIQPTIGNISAFGYGWGDIDGDHNFEVYIGSSYPYNVVSLEFQQGGSKTNPSDWTTSVLYAGDPTIISSMTIKDSTGTTADDTTKVVNTAFVSKMYSRKTDFDKDGFEDLILPYQVLNDSITVTTYAWNGSSYDTTVSKVVNPKRWGLRVIEGSANTTGIEAKDLTVITPNDFRLEQNYPNPFNPSTTIRFYLPVRSQISLKIYDILGKEVRTLVDQEEYAPGSSEVVWDGRNSAGQSVSSGTYFYALQFGNFYQTKKMTLVK